MNSDLANSLDELGEWRASLRQKLGALDRYLGEHELVSAEGREPLQALVERLSHEKLVVAFVAEFSRGKSELINAIFFADAGRRVLPASPGRTTMCPVELGYEAGLPPALALLPVETRLQAAPLSELRGKSELWHMIELNVSDPESLSEGLSEVTRTQWVSWEQAQALGFVDESRPEDAPVRNEQGDVEVPKWRHALINYPHPLLKQGLVVLDTPGLNAIGTEPELTLSLLPSAHATVFILGADTGVTKSDLAIWRDHLSAHAASRYVVLNKIDTLHDPLAEPEKVQAQIRSQQEATAQILEIAPERVFPISARQGLAGRIQKDADMLHQSRLEQLEGALIHQLLPQRREMVCTSLETGLQGIERQLARMLGDQLRQLGDQAAELRGLRGKSSAKVTMLLRRLAVETEEFERCTSRLQALRSVHARMIKDMLLNLSGDRIREELENWKTAMSATVLNLGAKKAFGDMVSRLQGWVTATEDRSVEIREMLQASFERLNAEYGFALTLSDLPSLASLQKELTLIERNYVQYLGITRAFKLGQPRFIEQFRRMLISKLRVLFEHESNELELWNKQAGAQIDLQLRERRRAFRHRREALERIQSAAGELESRLEELESHEARLLQYQSKVVELLAAVRLTVSQAPAMQRAPAPMPSLRRVDLPVDETEHLGEDLLTLNFSPSQESAPVLLAHQTPT